MTYNLPGITDKKSIVFDFLDKPVEIFKTENGHTIVIAHKEGELINVSTWVKTGSINEDDEITGVSHFLEHLMFKGTPRYAAGQFDRILEAKGAIVNAATWKDYTFYYVTLPKGENDKHFLEALELHADMMLNPLLPEEEIGPSFDVNNPDVKEKRERYVVIEEIKMRDDQPWSKTYNELNHIMYTEHPYKRDVIGTSEVIASIPRQKIMDYYLNWYTPDNMTTIIVGDVDSQSTVELVRKAFDFKIQPMKTYPEYTSEPHQTEPRNVENFGNINTGFLIFGFHGPKALNLKDTIGIDVISIILGEGKSSRLYQNLIEKPEQPIFNVIGSGQYQFKDGNTFFIQANFNPEFKNQAIDSVKSEIANILTSEILENELKKAKKKLKVKFADEAETVSSIGETIGYYMTVCNDISSYTDYLKILDTITIKDIHKIANEYLSLNKLSISVLTPKGNGIKEV